MMLAAALAALSMEYALMGWVWLMGRVYPNGWDLGGDNEPIPALKPLHDLFTWPSNCTASRDAGSPSPDAGFALAELNCGDVELNDDGNAGGESDDQEDAWSDAGNDAESGLADAAGLRWTINPVAPASVTPDTVDGPGAAGDHADTAPDTTKDPESGVDGTPL